MIETLLALIPDYGTFVVSMVVFLACLAVPLPASALVLAAGSFAAAGDLSLPVLGIGVCLAFILGDQVAFLTGARAGRPLIGKLRENASIGSVVARSEDLLARRGAAAVLMSHTIVSPTCPYVTYLAGAGGLTWHQFTFAAIPGAILWTAAYLGLGLIFASQLEQVVTLLGNFFGVIVAICILAALVMLLRDRWKKSQAT